jgi:glycosyltransferase-like protein
MKPLKIAMLTHSTNPRGGVIHAMELSSALHRLSHEVTLHAPDSRGEGFFRKGSYAQLPIHCEPARAGSYEMVQQRISDYVNYFTHTMSEHAFDMYHAHDGISGNALAILVERGIIPGYIRTVHHMDEFEDRRLRDLQLHSVLMAERVLCVSQLWQRHLAATYNLEADIVPTGVDRDRFSPHSTSEDDVLRQSLGLRASTKIFLSIGGIEPRKNTLNILKAFAEYHREKPNSQLIIAGGTSLLDHNEYANSFWNAAQFTSLSFGSGKDVILAPLIPDNAMPSLFRIADALVFASIKEGFGLVVLESIASGTPVILSRIPPFIEYMPDDSCFWINPHDVSSIVHAMHRILEPCVADGLRQAGLAHATTFCWRTSARSHADLYRSALNTRMGVKPEKIETLYAGVPYA